MRAFDNLKSRLSLLFGSRVCRPGRSVIGIGHVAPPEESLLKKELSNCNCIEHVSYAANVDGTKNFYIYESCDR